MDIWIYWVVAALALFIIELFTTGLAVICLAIGAVGGAIAAGCDATLNIQLLTFAIVSFIALAGVRPILKRTLLKNGEKVATNASAIVGKFGVVCNDIDAFDDSGRVVVDGIDWRAKSLTNEPLPKGTKVVVTAVDSVVLTVKKV